jgi:acyl-coenzyme A synthetase/AMP-(fatty) acid ligase
MNGAELLLGGHDPDRIALECRVADGIERIDYGELCRRVARAATVWQAHGLQPGDPVAVKLPDGIDWVVAWLGAMWAGGVAVGVNPRMPAAEWQATLEEARFALIVADDTDDESDDTPAAWRPRVRPLDAVRRAWGTAASCAPVQRGASAPALWVHSSGSSGRPKAVVHAQRALMQIALASRQRLGVRPADRLLSSSRLFFTYPLVNVLLAGLRMGATVLLDPAWPSAATLAAGVDRLRPSVLFSVPTLYRSLLHEGHAEAVRAAGVRLCVSAGETLSPLLREAWRQAAGVPMFDGYGTSETLVLVLGAASCDGALWPSPGVQVEPLDELAAAAGQPTRLLVRSATLALGYLDRPAAEADSFRAGAFCPADLFVREFDGGWRFAGREDSLVKLCGRWVDLTEIGDRLAADLPGLREAAAAVVADADGVDALAFFYAADEPEATRLRLLERIAKLRPHQRPAWLHALPELPRTATGKLLRRQLAACLRRPCA